MDGLSYQPEPSPSKQSSNAKKKIALFLFLVILLVTALLTCYFTLSRWRTPEEFAQESQSQINVAPDESIAGNGEIIAQPELYYPTGVLFSVKMMEDYQDGDITLEIPRIEYYGGVLKGVDEDTVLTRGIGLYDYATLPGHAPSGYIDNHNLSIAGHRDVQGSEFYYIDTIIQGDEMYITYNGKRYTYTYMDTRVVEEDDWSVIYCTHQPILTLTSCEPIGVASHRIIVRGVLTGIEDL